MMADLEKFHFRLVLLGSNGTGKTSILNRFLFKKFETKYKPTVEDLFTKDFDLGSIEIKVDFLDTSGSMQFPAMRRLSITTGSAFLIVYSVDDDISYEVLKMCIAEIQEVRPDYQEIPIVFAGNKCDTPRERRKVHKEIVSNYVHYELPRLRAKVIECSCKDGTNIDNIFRAYLSLAKVSLSSAVSVGLKSSRPPSRTSTDCSASEQSSNECTDNNGRRPSSLKVVLGVRKSCDASIASSTAKSCSSSSHSSSSSSIAKQQLAAAAATTAGATNQEAASETTAAAAAAAAAYSPQQRRPTSGAIKAMTTATTTTGVVALGSPSQAGSRRDSLAAEAANDYDDGDEVNLETAIQSKLSVSGRTRTKPRSRSLIWRSARKSRSAVEQSECRVS